MSSTTVVLFIVCGAFVSLALYMASLELYPEWPTLLKKAVLKAVLHLIDAVGTLCWSGAAGPWQFTSYWNGSVFLNGLLNDLASRFTLLLSFFHWNPACALRYDLLHLCLNRGKIGKIKNSLRKPNRDSEAKAH
jgi:hypothetical protein